MSHWLSSLPGTQAHVLLEAAAYFVGARVYWRAAKGLPQPPSKVDRWLLVASAVFGAFVGSKLTHLAEHLRWLLDQHAFEPWLPGKSILGGLVGGHLGVEVAKKAIRWRPSTGDAWVPAIAVGLVIGRLGCQLSGPWDQTYGTPTGLPWAWDYGDGIGRHPTSAYEIVLVAGLAWSCTRARLRVTRPGAAFALFMLGYCAIRLLLEFLKPPFGAAIDGTLPVSRYAGLTAIQWLAIAGIIGYAGLARRRLGLAGPTRSVRSA